MQVSIPFTELSDLIRRETGQPIVFAYKSDNEVFVNYAASIKLPLFGAVNKDVYAGVKLLEVSNDKVLVQLDVGVLNGVVDLFSSFVLGKLPSGLVESFTDGIATLRLSAIPQLRPVLDRLEFVGVSMDPNQIIINARTKRQSVPPF